MRLKRLLPVETTNLLSPRSKADKYSEQNDFLWIAAQFHKVQGQAKLAAACAYSPNYDVDGYWETDSRTRRHHLDAKRWIWGAGLKTKTGKTLPKPQGSVSPKKQTKETTSYDSDPAVVAWAFKKSVKNARVVRTPRFFWNLMETSILIVHHLRRLSDGGSDTVTNAAAVCCNCQRELHYGIGSKSRLNRLCSTVKRLEREWNGQ